MKLLMRFNNDIILRCNPWSTRVNSLFKNALEVEGNVSESTNLLKYMYCFESHFHDMHANFFNRNLNLFLNEIEAFTILFIFSVSSQTSSYDISTILGLCQLTTNNNKFSSFLTKSFKRYFTDDSDNLEVIIRKYIKFIRKTVKVETPVMMAGIYNDLVNNLSYCDVDHKESIDSEDDLIKLIMELIMPSTDDGTDNQDEIMSYFHNRIFSKCNITATFEKEHIDIDNITMYEDVLFSVPPDKMKKKYHNLPELFGMYQLYTIKKFICSNTISQSEEFKHFFTNLSTKD